MGRMVLFSIPLIFSQTPVYTMRATRPWIWGSASQGVPVYIPAFASYHCTYPRRHGQAQLTWIVRYIPILFTHLPMAERNRNIIINKPERYNLSQQNNYKTIMPMDAEQCISLSDSSAPYYILHSCENNKTITYLYM